MGTLLVFPLVIFEGVPFYLNVDLSYLGLYSVVDTPCKSNWGIASFRLCPLNFRYLDEYWTLKIDIIICFVDEVTFDLLVLIVISSHAGGSRCGR